MNVQDPNDNQSKSYVDSYVPPSDGQNSGQGGDQQPNNQQTTTTPNKQSSQAQQSDPLAELERLLKESEKESQEKPVVDQSPPKPQPKPQSKSELKPESKSANNKQSTQQSDQALKELERLLLEYEDRRKSKTGGRPDSKPKKTDSSKKSSFSKPAKQTEEHKEPSKQTKEPAKPESDPLAELEKALKEYEAKQSKPGEKPQPKFEKAAEPVAPVVDEPAVDSRTSTPAPNSASAKEAQTVESIEQINIFDLIGSTDASNQEKEAFLDELQEAIWDDFLDKDLELLVTSEEFDQLKQTRNQAAVNPQDVKIQEELINEVEKLVPDVSEIMLEKALEIKEDLAWERIEGMKENYQGNPDALKKIEEASEHFKKGHWQVGSTVLNSIIS